MAEQKRLVSTGLRTTFKDELELGRYAERYIIVFRIVLSMHLEK
jgi:hypothetical protein